METKVKKEPARNDDIKIVSRKEWERLMREIAELREQIRLVRMTLDGNGISY